MILTSASFKTPRPKDGMKRMINGLDDQNLGVFGSLGLWVSLIKETAKRPTKRLSQLRVTELFFAKCLDAFRLPTLATFGKSRASNLLALGYR